MVLARCSASGHEYVYRRLAIDITRRSSHKHQQLWRRCFPDVLGLFLVAGNGSTKILGGRGGKTERNARLPECAAIIAAFFAAHGLAPWRVTLIDCHLDKTFAANSPLTDDGPPKRRAGS